MMSSDNFFFQNWGVGVPNFSLSVKNGTPEGGGRVYWAQNTYPALSGEPFFEDTYYPILKKKDKMDRR